MLNVLFIVLWIWSFSVTIVVYFTLGVYKLWQSSSTNTKTALWTMLLICSWLAPISPFLIPAWLTSFALENGTPFLDWPAFFSTYFGRSGKSICLLIWGGGVIYHGICLLQSYCDIHRVLATAEPVQNSEILACVARIRRMMFLDSQITVLQGKIICSPFVARFRNPVIFLPKFVIQESTPRELEAIIAHELAHLYRYDLHIHHAMYGLKIILWFIPPIHTMYNELLKVQDTSSDEYAASLLGSSREYGAALVQSVNRILQQHKLKTQTVYCQSQNFMLYRLENIKHLSLSKVSRLSLICRTGIVLYSIFMLLLIGFLVKVSAPYYTQSLQGDRPQNQSVLSTTGAPENVVPKMGFIEMVPLAATTASTEHLRVEDADNDGFPDWTKGVKLGVADVNADGFPDWVVGVEAGKANRIYYNEKGKAGSRSIALDNRRYKVENTACADVDRDGDMDVAFCSHFQPNVIHFNNGDGTFSRSVRFGSSNDMTESIQLGDLNQDGWIDAITCNRYGDIFLYMNNGQGRFTPTQILHTLRTLKVSNLLLMDADRDADLDIVWWCQIEENPIRIFLNDSQGHYSTAPLIPKITFPKDSRHWVFDSPRDGGLATILLLSFDKETARFYECSPMVSLVEKSRLLLSGQPEFCDMGDADQDGDLDLIFGSRHIQPRLYINEGDLHFSRPYSLGDTSKKAALLRFSDFDYDGDLDILSMQGDGTFEGYRNQLPLQVHSVTPMIPATLSSSALPIAVSFDHRIKIPKPTAVNLYGSQTGKHNGRVHLEDDRTLVFNPQQSLLPGEPYFLSLYGVQTVNRESLPKPFVMNGYAPTAKAPMRFDAKQKDIAPADMWYPLVKLGDLDGDGDLDVTAGGRASPRTIYRNQGHGEFVESTRIGAPQDEVRSIALADYEGDGDLDLILGYWKNLPPNIFINDGRGNFSRKQMMRGVVEFNSIIAPGDVNGDGKLDYACFHRQNTVGDHQVLISRKDGEMEESCRFGENIVSINDLQFCDFDRDGDLDILTAAYEEGNRFFPNDGKGRFNTGSRYLKVDHGSSLRCADFDADGDLDVIYQQVMPDKTTDLKLVLNDGKGEVEKVISLTAPEKFSDLQIGDLDGDGWMDAVISAMEGTPALIIYHNLGNTQFEQIEAVKTPAVSPASMAVGDLDGDGDLDIVYLEKGGRMRLLYNEEIGDQFARNNAIP